MSAALYVPSLVNHGVIFAVKVNGFVLSIAESNMGALSLTDPLGSRKKVTLFRTAKFKNAVTFHSHKNQHH